MFLAVALNKVTSYYTHTSHNPVKSLARACQTGHATNIIQGFAVGYESTVAALLVIVDGDHALGAVSTGACRRSSSPTAWP